MRAEGEATAGYSPSTAAAAMQPGCSTTHPMPVPIAPAADKLCFVSWDALCPGRSTTTPFARAATLKETPRQAIDCATQLQNQRFGLVREGGVIERALRRPGLVAQRAWPDFGMAREQQQVWLGENA